MLRCAQHDRIEITKNPDAGSGFDEVKYGYLLFSHRYARINLPTMRGLNMMVVLERGLVHDGQYSMLGRGMSQGDTFIYLDSAPEESLRDEGRQPQLRE